ALVAAVIFVGPTIYLVQDRYFERMATIKDYENEESAATRVELWGVAIRMWQGYPVFGVAFGNPSLAALSSRYLNRPNRKVAHNRYLQMLVDSGIFAFLIYCSLLFGTMLWLSRSTKQLKATNSEAANISLGFQTALMAYSAGATFYSHQRYDLFYI